MNRCARCYTIGVRLWSTVEFFAGSGEYRALDLCLPCSRVVAAAINLPIQGASMQTLFPWSVPLNDPEDIDDGEHHAQCRCHECDPDFRFDWQREERYA